MTPEQRVKKFKSLPSEVVFPDESKATMFPESTTGWQYIGYGIKMLWHRFKLKFNKK
jgi:hypothetical protein